MDATLRSKTCRWPVVRRGPGDDVRRRSGVRPRVHRLTRALATPPRDLREWIALLEREGELRRIRPRPTPTSRSPRSSTASSSRAGRRSSSRIRRARSTRSSSTSSAASGACASRLGVESLDDAAAKLGDILDMQPPEGIREKVKGLLKLKSVADSRPKMVSQGAVPGALLRGRRRRSHAAPDPALLAGRPAPFITLPAVITQDPEDGYAQRRHVPDAGDRPLVDVHALADAQGRPRRSPRRRGRPHPGRGRDRARPGDGVLGERAAPEAPRRAHARRVPARRAGRARPLQDGPARGARERRDRPRGLGGEGRRRHRGPVRRPHGLLLARRAVPDLPDLRDDDAARRDLRVDRRRQAAGRGRVARQGDRADLPAGRAHDAARDRRLRPAGRGRVPQLRDRLDPQDVPRPRAEGHARALGARDALALEVDRRRRRARGRARLRGRLLPRDRERRPEARRPDHRGAARPPRPRARAAVLRRQARHRRDPQASRRRTRGRGRRRSSCRTRSASSSRGAGPSTGSTRCHDTRPSQSAESSRRDRRHVVDMRDRRAIESTARRRVERHEPRHPARTWPEPLADRFAIGVACLLLGLVISWIVAAIGAVLAVVFGILWARDVTRDVRDDVPHDRAGDARGRGRRRRPARRPRLPRRAEPLPAYTRSRFLEAIDDRPRRGDRRVVTLPVLGFTVLPSFTNLEETRPTSGRSRTSRRATYVIASFLANPNAGEVSPADVVRPEQRPVENRTTGD